MNPTSNIYIAGHRGLVGSALMCNLQSSGYANPLTRIHADLDCYLAAFEALQTQLSKTLAPTLDQKHEEAC